MSKRKKNKSAYARIDTSTPAAPTTEQLCSEPTHTVEPVGDEQPLTAAAEPTEAAPATLEPVPDLVLESEQSNREEPDVTAASALTLPPPSTKRLSALDAAAQVLAEARTPMSCQELIGAMAVNGLWSSPNGKTPAATLYSAIIREISTRGRDARFKKTGRGTFAAN